MIFQVILYLFYVLFWNINKKIKITQYTKKIKYNKNNKDNF
jgi:hypothetical protein